MRSAGAALAAALCLLLAACAARPAVDGYHVTNETVARNFMRIAFGSEHGQGTNERISKWVSPRIRVFLSTDTLDTDRLTQVQGVVERQMRRLERLTGRRFLFPGSERAEESQIIVFVVPRATLARELEDRFKVDPQTVECFGGAFRSGRDGNDGIIVGALIGIPDDLPPADMEACLVEELAQSMGLFMDDDQVIPSIFNDDDVFKDLTWMDELLLRVLYDPRMRPGLNRAQAAPLARRIIDELRPSGK